MIIKFDTSTVKPLEVLGLIAFLEVIRPVSSDNNLTPQAPEASLAEPAPPTEVPAPTHGPTLVPTPEPEAPARKRRTKAEIAADEAAAKQAATPAESTESQSTTAVIANANKTVSADELRTLLNGYIAKHSMEEAIEILKSFGCNRVTEALALEPTKLAELAAALRG